MNNESKYLEGGSRGLFQRETLRIAGNQAETQTWYISNIGLARYSCTNLVGTQMDSSA